MTYCDLCVTMSLAPLNMYGFSLLKLVKLSFVFLLFATVVITPVNKDYQKYNGLPYSRAAIIRPSRSVQPKRGHFSPVTVNSDPWPWPSNLTDGQGEPALVKGHFVQKLLFEHTDTHTHTHTHTCTYRTDCSIAVRATFFYHLLFYFLTSLSLTFLPEQAHSVSRPEVVGGERTWV